MKKENGNVVVICPPCGENVALATKRGANKVLPILPLLPRLTAVLPPQGREITARGFTLIELLVVVLIIGILAAVAVPQYQKAVEKSRITEAIVNLRAIANANQVYYLANGEYATGDDMDKLDVDIPGTIYEGSVFTGRTTTQYFVYSPNGESGKFLAVAWRIDMDESNTIISAPYQLTIKVTDPEKIHCYSRDNASAVQKNCAGK